MMGRVTQGMLNTQLLRNLNHNLVRMNNTQNQLATGMKINKPSDDPVGLSFAMRYRSELTANEQYQENVDSAISWLEFTDSMLSQAGDVFNRVRDVTVQAANGSNPEDALKAIKSEVTQLYDQFVTIGNTNFNGKHVFNGQKTDVPPYTNATAATDVTDTGSVKFDIGGGSALSVNVTGNAVFGAPTDTDNAFKVLNDLIGSLDSNNPSAISSILGDLDTRINKFLEVRADVGAKLNRIELASNRLQDSEANLQTLQSKVEDADMAELATIMQSQENVYQASLSVGAKLISPSLVDFLR